MIIKRNGYFGIVLHESGDNLYVATPKFKKVFKKAGDNSAAYESYLEFVKNTEKKRGFVRVKLEDDYTVVDTDLDTLKEAVVKIISLSSNTIEAATSKMASKKNPLEKYVMDQYFGDGKKIKAINEAKVDAVKVVTDLGVLSSRIEEIMAKIEGLSGSLDTQAEFMNAAGVEEAYEKLSATLKVMSDNEVAEQIMTIAESLNPKSGEEFDAESFLGL